MKKPLLPDSTKKHKLLHDNRKSPEELVALGEIFFQAGHLYDAVTFFTKASFQDGLERVKTLALEKGDSFIFQMVLKAVRGQGTREQWEALGKRAMELKKYSHAVRAFRESGNEAARGEAEQAMKALSS